MRACKRVGAWVRLGLDASAEARPLLQRAWPACIASSAHDEAE